MRWDHVLCFVDEEPDLGVLQRAAHIAAVNDAALTVVAVVPQARSQVVLSRPALDLGKVEDLLAEDRQRQLEEAVENLGTSEVDAKIVVLRGQPLESLVDYVAEHRVDYLLKAPSPGDGLREQLFGGIDKRLMRAAPCTVGIGPERRPGGPRRAIAAVDMDEGDELKAALNRRILDAAHMVWSVEGFEIYIIHAWDLYGYSILAHGRGRIPPEKLKSALDQEQARRREWLDALIDDFRESLDPEQAAGFKPTPLLVRGDPVRVIPQKARELEADAVGLGTASRKGLGGLMIGNTAEEILNRVDCAVVALKPEGFESSFGSA